MSTAVIALALLPIALAVMAGLVGLMTRPLLVPAARAIERGRVRQHLGRAVRADALLAAHRVEPALREIEAAFCLLVVRADPTLVEEIERHHTGLLSRLLSVADESPTSRVRLLALAKVDRLLDRRAKLQRAHLQLRGRPRGDLRRAQLLRQLRDNASATRAAVRELVADVQLLGGRRAAAR